MLGQAQRGAPGQTRTRLIVEPAMPVSLSVLPLDDPAEASRVADVFYVREQTGGKLTPERADEAKLALAEALGRFSVS